MRLSHMAFIFFLTLSGNGFAFGEDNSDAMKSFRLPPLLHRKSAGDFLFEEELSDKMIPPSTPSSRQEFLIRDTRKDAKELARRQIEVEKGAALPELGINKFPNEEIYHLEFERKDDMVLFDWRLYNFIEAPDKKMLNVFESFRVLAIRRYYTGYGSDYSVRDIVAFFNEAAQRKIQLNPWETRLQRRIMEFGLVKKSGWKFVALKDGAVIASLVGDKPALDHEINHGVYFTDGEYRRQSNLLYDGLSQKEKELLRMVVKPTEYDYSDHDLIAREFVASFRDWEQLTGVSFNPDNVQRALLRQLNTRVLALDRYSRYYRALNSSASGKSLDRTTTK
jgi:hypothetical protein